MPQKHFNRWSRRHAGLAAVSLTALLVLAWVAARGQVRREQEVLALAEPSRHGVYGVETARAEHAADAWSGALNAYIGLDESKTARVGVPLSGRVVRVLVELGQEVKRGDPLFSVSSPELPTLRAEQRRAELEVEAAKVEHDRVRDLVAANALPGRTGRTTSIQLEQAVLGLRAARAKQSSLSLGTLSSFEFVVRAPRAGRVIEKHLLPGQQLLARSERPLLTIADLSTVWLVADLFDAEAGALSLGTEAEIEVPSQPGLGLSGRVADIAGVVDDHRRTVRVRVPLDNTDGRLRINALAKVRFLAAAPPGSALVSSNSLRSDGARNYVYVRSDAGEYARREVTHGILPSERALILSGIVPGEEVVIKGMSLLDSRIDLASTQ